MQDAATVLDIIRERSARGLPLDRVYRLLYNPSFYLYAYGRLSTNDGAMTPGVTGETVDGMSLAKIQEIIARIRQEQYVWRPVRRIYIPKKRGGKRPLGIPDWGDKLVQEVMRLILEAHYEPRFSHHSHGFRPDRGCHTALQEVKRWSGTKWFIEGDIKGCFDNIDHGVLLSILAETIHDNRFLHMVRHLLQAGYLEDWRKHATLSGTPQGGVVSPILANVYLDRLDHWIEQHLLPAYTKGKHRARLKAYDQITYHILRERKAGNRPTVRQLVQARRHLPSKDPDDPQYRRLWYVRYADDFLLGFIGPNSEAEEIKRNLGEFLQGTLKLDLSQEKTLVTHARTHPARFLGYEVAIQYRDDLLTDKGRHTNGKVALRVPGDVIDEYVEQYGKGGHPRVDKVLVHDSDFTIVDRYGAIFRGVYHYYCWAQNAAWLTRLKHAMELSLLHTLACKHRTTIRKVRKRLKTQRDTTDGPRICLEVHVERPGKKPLVARFGGFPVARHEVPISDDIRPYLGPRLDRTERIQRLLHEVCELCGHRGPVEGHHLRKLADLHRYGRTPPAWVTHMAARRRKTLYVCHACHLAITYGRMNLTRPLTESTTGEPDALKGARPVRGGADGKG